MPMTSIATFVTPMAEPRTSPFSMASAVLLMWVSRFCAWVVVVPVVPVPLGATSVSPLVFAPESVTRERLDVLVLGRLVAVRRLAQPVLHLVDGLARVVHALPDLAPPPP